MKSRGPRAFTLAFLLLLFFATAVLAVDLSIGNVDGTWSDPVSTGGALDCVALDNSPGDITNENTFRSGRPTTATAPDCGNVSDRSGYGFDGINGTTATNDVPFLLGEFTHFNRTISPPALASLLLTYAIEVNGTPYDFAFTVELDETANNPSSHPDDVCPYPAGTGPGDTAYDALNGGFGAGGTSYRCGDKTSFTPVTSSTTFPNPDDPGTEIALSILSFVDDGGDGCDQEDYDAGAPLNEFLTRETQDTTACLFAMFVVQTPSAVDLSGAQASAPAQASGTSLLIVAVLLAATGLLLSLRRRAGRRALANN
jgi:hypothetical protein